MEESINQDLDCVFQEQPALKIPPRKKLVNQTYRTSLNVSDHDSSNNSKKGS